jgi:hypothetical protein
MSQAPKVRNGKLYNTQGREICNVSTEAVPSSAWVRWLQNPANRSFRFVGENGEFLAVHQYRLSKADSRIQWVYWYAQIAPRGKTFHRSLGPIRNARAITLEKMELVADKLAKHIPRVDFREAGIERPQREQWRKALRQRPRRPRRAGGDEVGEVQAEQLALFGDGAGPGLGDYAD